jgi:hypothetical protein
MHISLDFTAPFNVGDKVVTAYPPGANIAMSGPAIPGHLQATIGAIKIIFELAPDNGLVVTQPTAEKSLTVEQLVYTLLPEPSLGLSAFMAECSMGENEAPKLFISEEEFLSASLHRSA